MIAAAPPAATAAPRGWGVPLLMLLTPVLLVPVFAPYGLWPLAFVALVPWTVGLCLIPRRGAAYAAALGTFAVAFFVLTGWLSLVTVPGHIVAVLVQTLYLLPVVIAIRFAADRTRWPMWLVLPVAWTAGEYFRGLGLAGFPWFYLAHGFYGELWAIQVCDLFGTFGLTFAVAAVNGWLADLVLRRAGRASTPAWAGAAAAVALWAGIGAYGVYQLRASDQRMVAGPSVAVVQDDLPVTIDGGLGLEADEILEAMVDLSFIAASHRPLPDLIVWPESMVTEPFFLNREFITADLDAATAADLLHPEVRKRRGGDPEDLRSFVVEVKQQPSIEQERRVAALSTRLGTPLLVGLTALVPLPPGGPYRFERFNSTLMFDPILGQLPGRHDKLKVVPMGEAVPFRRTRLHWLYELINRYATPYGDGGHDYSLDEGRRLQVFDLVGRAPATGPAATQPASGPAARYRFATPICYESTFPSFNRLWAAPRDGRKGVDFLVNVSNDGWFQRGAELPQHLAVCVFRAVETRVGIARAVNTGISAFIKPTGEVYGQVRQDPDDPQSPAWTGLGMPERELTVRRADLEVSLFDRSLPRAERERIRAELVALNDQIANVARVAGVRGVSVQTVWLDPQVTLYARIGDVLPMILLAGVFAVQFAAWRRWVQDRAARRAAARAA